MPDLEKHLISLQNRFSIHSTTKALDDRSAIASLKNARVQPPEPLSFWCAAERSRLAGGRAKQGVWGFFEVGRLNEHPRRAHQMSPQKLRYSQSVHRPRTAVASGNSSKSRIWTKAAERQARKRSSITTSYTRSSGMR